MTQAFQRQPNYGLERITHNLREALCIVLVTMAGYLLLSLFSYHPEDPGWTHAVEVENINNSAGVLGAWIADMLLYLFGYFAYLFPIILLVSGFRLLQNKHNQIPFYINYFFLRGGGVVCGFIGGCMLSWMHQDITGTALPHQTRGAGGVIGDILGTSLMYNTGETGATLIGLAIFIAGFTLYTGLSWTWIMDYIGRFLYRGLIWLFECWETYSDIYIGSQEKYRRHQIFKREQPQIRERPKVRVEPVVSDIDAGERGSTEKQKTLFSLPAETRLPKLDLLSDKAVSPDIIEEQPGYTEEELTKLSRRVELKIKEFGVVAEVVAVCPGPVVTRFELQLAPGTKASKITNLSKDLARSLSVISARVVEVIPGKSVIGLEIPNENRAIVLLGEILNSREYQDMNSPLTLVLGKDISGRPFVTDLCKMPHLLVAGTTGAGKSVALNAMILSLLYKSTAQEVRIIMIDPKMLELSVYAGIPHLLAPVVTDMKQASNALSWCVAEMERRYQIMATMGVRNIFGYNRKIIDAIKKGDPIANPLQTNTNEATEDDFLKPLPFIVVIIDELADMMMTTGKKVEQLIARLAQKARAAGIHLVLATQRPSVDVITGLIKANIPCRIAFQVSSKIDSRTILDQMGAENLLGHGDMLFLKPGGANAPERVHGAFVSDQDVHQVVENLKKDSQPDYHEEVLAGKLHEADQYKGGGQSGDQTDPLYDEAVKIVLDSKKASISYIQRRLRIGYNRAARLIELMETNGLVSPLASNGSREILTTQSEP